MFLLGLYSKAEFEWFAYVLFCHLCGVLYCKNVFILCVVYFTGINDDTSVKAIVL